LLKIDVYVQGKNTESEVEKKHINELKKVGYKIKNSMVMKHMIITICSIC